MFKLLGYQPDFAEIGVLIIPVKHICFTTEIVLICSFTVIAYFENLIVAKNAQTLVIYIDDSF